ncbi:MAG: hydrogenase maturation protease [Candidatus Heimdallarchaeaceae archaeon]
MKTILIGIGNPIVGDDAIGIKVVEELNNNYQFPSLVDIVPDVSVGGLPLVELMIGYDRAIVVDAIETGSHPPGTIVQFEPDLSKSSVYISDYHNLDFLSALSFAKQFYGNIPKQITIIGVEIRGKLEFSDKLSPTLQAQFPQIVQKIYQIIVNQLTEECEANF